MTADFRYDTSPPEADSHHDSGSHNLLSDAYNWGSNAVSNVVHTVEEHPVETAVIIGGAIAAAYLTKDWGDSEKGAGSFFSKLGEKGDPLVMMRRPDGSVVQRTFSSLKNDGFFEQDPWWKQMWEQMKEGLRN